MKVKTGKVEKNIQCELRSGSVRFSVEVYPLKKSQRTFDLDEYEQGLMWARRERVELLDQKAKTKNVVAPAPLAAPDVATTLNPAHIRLSDVFENFRIRELPRLSGAASDFSRLKRLEEWFGQLSLGELSSDLLNKWLIDRASGALGVGRISYPPGYSKNRRTLIRRAQAAGKQFLSDGTPAKLPEPLAKPPSDQTIRHEITLLRRTLNAYFVVKKLNKDHGVWLKYQDVMMIDMPKKPDPRNTRVDELGLQALVRELDDPTLAAFCRFAVITTLRRSEVCSLRWEDFDSKKRIIKLRAPGHMKKSKTHTREVPLLSKAIQILEKLGIKEKGPLFNISPSGISQAIRRAADKAGLYDLRLHDLRREGISRLLELLQASYEDVSLFSGHSDIKTLKDHYARPCASKVRDRLERHPGITAMMSEV